MRDERLLDIEGVDEHLPGVVVDAKDGLIFLDVVLSLLGDVVGLCRHCDALERRIFVGDIALTQ